jgi:hypothetical protein
MDAASFAEGLHRFTGNDFDSLVFAFRPDRTGQTGIGIVCKKHGDGLFPLQRFAGLFDADNLAGRRRQRFQIHAVHSLNGHTFCVILGYCNISYKPCQYIFHNFFRRQQWIYAIPLFHVPTCFIHPVPTKKKFLETGLRTAHPTLPRPEKDTTTEYTVFKEMASDMP